MAAVLTSRLSFRILKEIRFPSFLAEEEVAAFHCLQTQLSWWLTSLGFVVWHSHQVADLLEPI